jgi:pilus assembly protein CpaB
MNKRLAGILLFALVISAAASFLLYQLIAKRITSQQDVPTTKLLVAARNLEVGAMLKEGDVRLADWKGAVPPHALSKPEEVVNRGVVASIFEGEPILEERLAAKGAGAGLAATIPVGMRAVAVRVNDVVGVAGFVTPGQRVDILIMGTTPNMSNSLGTLARTLLQNLEVLSAGQQVQKDNEGKPIPVPVVNLLVTPEQAEILSLASNEARIQLVLRNPLDTKEVTPPGTSLAYLFTGSGKGGPVAPAKGAPAGGPIQTRTRPAYVPPPAPKKESVSLLVEVLQGTKRSTAKFEESTRSENKAEEK